MPSYRSSLAGSMLVNEVRGHGSKPRPGICKKNQIWNITSPELTKIPNEKFLKNF